MEDKEESLKDKLDKLIQQNELVAMQNQPKFKLPLSVRIQQGKALKKEWAIVLYIRTNGSTQIKMKRIEDDTIKFNDYIYDARAGNVLRYKKLPLIIIKEWNISPEAPPEKHTLDLEKDYEDASKNGKLTAAQKLILTKLKMEAIKPKMQLNFGMVLIILAVLGGGYFLLNSMGVI